MHLTDSFGRPVRRVSGLSVAFFSLVLQPTILYPEYQPFR
jgi:hypothetical protein